MTAWIMRALSALLAAAILLAAPTPSAPVAVSQQSTKTQQVQQAPKEEETQKPPIPDPAKSTLPIKADPEEPQPTAQKEATAVKTDAPRQTPAKAVPSSAQQGEPPTEPDAADKPSLADLGPQFWEIVELTLNGKFMSSQNPKLVAFAQPFYQWLSDNDYFDINIVYDEDRNVFRDDGQRGIVAIGFDYDATQGIYFSAHDPWMRKLGYCELYDQIAPHFGYYLDTKRFQFDYDGYEWMLQVWKGEYLWCATGAEMGLYYREPGSTLTDDFYNTIPDEKMIPMEMTLYHNGKYKFKREMEKTWWQTGFIFCYMCEPEEVAVEARVEFPNAEMRDAFLTALEGEGYVRNETYTLDGNVVCFAY